MKVLIIGGGGREHAIAMKLKESKKVTKLYAAPGNGGIAQIAECFDVKATDIDSMVALAVRLNPDLVVVAPDDPLMLGMVDAMNEAGFRAFGPERKAAIIEGSKVFSKKLMKEYNIPTADYCVFSEYKEALNYVKSRNEYPTVIKAEGLALGKGVVIAKNFDEAQEALDEMMNQKIFGDSGTRVVIEQFLQGPEISVLAFCDGKTIKPMVSAQDHKRAYDNDEGPNTGGMGTFSPSRIYNEEMAKECMEKIFIPTMNAMNKQERTFKGVLYFGLMATKDGVKVIEYNCRFGDPETQVVLPRLKTDLYDIMIACTSGTLDKINIEWDDSAAVCVVMASGGYPKKYQTGYEISGIADAEKSGALVYHAGTKNVDGKIITAGGRVLGVTALGENIEAAREKAYDYVKKITFKDVHYRKDIGIK